MPKILPLVIYPSPVLRNKTREIGIEELQQPKIQQLILDMKKTMLESDGIGLAAIQVGENIRLAVINTSDGVLALVNPIIISKSFRKSIGDEGCLSVPGVFGLVKRPIKIRIQAIDSKGKEVKFTAAGMFARVIQHEVDHLDGILFIDRVKKITIGQDILKKMRAKDSH